MLAEVEQISDARARRRFTRGCLGALALSTPRLVGAFVVAGLLSVAVVMAALLSYPGLVTGRGTWLAIGVFSAVILGYIVAAAGLSARLATTMSTTTVCMSATAIAGSWLLVGFCPSAEPPPAVPMTLLALAPAVALGLGWRATRRATPLIGVQCVSLTALVAGLGLFLVWTGQAVIFAGRPYDVGMVRDFQTSAATDLATYAVSDSLGSGMMLLLLVPLVSLAAGASGAAMASRWRRPNHNAV